MTDIAPTPATTPRAPRRGFVWLWLVTLLALAGGGVFWWMQTEQGRLDGAQAQLQQQAMQLHNLERQQQALSSHLDDTGNSSRKSAGAIEQLQATQQEHTRTLQTVEGALSAGRRRYQLAAAEELLQLAHDRAALGTDAALVATALQLADARLASLNDSRLLALRQTLATERLAVLALPQPDVTGAALAIGSLLVSADAMALKTRIPVTAERSAPPAAAPDAAETRAEWPQRLLAGLGAAFKAVFHIRREARPIDRLLDPEQQALVKLMLRSQLEAARLALLRGDAAVWRQTLDEAQRWLDDRYSGEDGAVKAAHAELLRLRALPPPTAVPPPEKALNQLRALLAGE
jgi:uroporphyrin-III C-methyltransferase